MSLDNIVHGDPIIATLDRIDRDLLEAKAKVYSYTQASAEKINNAIIRMTGNRVTLLGYGLTVGGIGSLLHTIGTPSLLNIGIGMLSVITFSIGTGFVGITNEGRETFTHYKRAKEHIDNHGRLEPRYAEKVILGSENHSFIGYCQQQGLYLAARDYGQLEVFERVRKAHSNVKIPHF